MIEYICVLCGEKFTSDRELHPTLQICRTCRDNNKTLVQSRINEINRAKREEKKKYWESHPEEYKEFLAERKRKGEESKIKKYGSLENAEKARKQKQFETLKLKYPDEDWDNIVNIGQISEIKKKIKDKADQKDSEFYKERQSKRESTIVEKYGSLEEYYDLISKKQKETFLDRYGVESGFQTEKCNEFRNKTKETDPEYFSKRKEKIDNTKIEKYGSLENAYNSMMDNYKKTCLDRYGVEFATQSENVRSKISETFNFRKENEPDFLENIKYKTEDTKIRKYGSLEEAQNIAKIKRESTCIERYGTSTPLLNKDVQNKIKNTCIQKYGVDNISKLSCHKDKVQETVEKDISKFESENNCIHVKKLVEKYGQGFFTLDIPKLKYKRYTFISCSYIPEIEEYYRIGKTPVSHAEKDILDFVKSIYKGEIIENTRLVINPLELDIYLPEKKLAIEYNGDFWHSTDCKPKNYHELKSKMCEEKGIRLIHIYECEWRYYSEKIKSLLRIALGTGYSKIGARQCEVRKITNKEAEPFNNKNHLQNHRNALVTYGLFYNGELQQLMSFSHTKYNKNLKGDNQWEIIRGCPGSNNQIVGGVSKLFKAFIRDYNPDLVFSYCDFNKFDGKGYEAIGMKFAGYTGPDKFYVDKSGCKINRNPKKQKEMEDSCLYTIFGSGSKKYIWTKEQNA